MGGRRIGKAVLAAAGIAALALAGISAPASAFDESKTTTPIKNVVIIFQENVSFDHYFATYPVAANPDGEPAFIAAGDTPTVNGLDTSLLDPNNPNSVQPFRLGRDQAETCDQDHNYQREQMAFDSGLMDKFVESVGRAPQDCPSYNKGKGLVMGYYDGNTVTAMWNYAQRFAMSDNFYGSTFGPSTPGAINLVTGQTHGFTMTSPVVTPNATMVGDPQPTGDICDTRDTSASNDPANRNIGDLLNAKGVSWGWFEGGFADCTVTHTNVGGITSKDYIPHHEPFQYYTSTANLAHTPPASTREIGHDGQANHQYDLTDFWAAVDARSMPAVSFLKAPAYQDGHAGYSTPLDEQHFVVETINRLQSTKYWKHMAVIIAYDDSDGWYDHQMGPIVNQSMDPKEDGLTADNSCGHTPARVSGGYQDRCGYGPRLPLLVVSPYAKSNFVDHSVTDQTSILRFIEDNCGAGRIGNASFDEKAGSLNNLFNFDHRTGHRLYLDPETGLRR
ncbi:phospholipase C [Microlunatus sp. Gsoil 973]|uniref:phospholipase C n=1 Tax=Microlunatus sp. Gsoil 973 TaxID=2672569 RepID=UPI0012B49E64|nr:alkaline phosphatase family protein [Microlunatus sp. Gsoil 973]QGN32590.1 phospholipase [Microlunatus sp. Gsoil 973]